MRLQLTPTLSSESHTPVTLLSERHWGRLNPTLLTDSISLAYMCSSLWNTTEHYQSCSSVVFIDSVTSGFDPRNNRIRYCDSELNSMEHCKTDNRSVNSLLFTELEISLLFSQQPHSEPNFGSTKASSHSRILLFISTSHLLRACYILRPSQVQNLFKTVC